MYYEFTAMAVGESYLENWTAFGEVWETVI